MTTDLRPYPEYKNSGLAWLGQIPAHWEVRRCKYLFREVDERSKTGEETHLSMSQQHGLIASSDLDGRRLYSESYAGGKLCQANDLVLNRLKAHLGVFARARQPGVVSPDYTVLRPLHDDDVVFFELLFKTPACVAELRCSTKGIVEGFWRLYTDDFYSTRVPVPPVEERNIILRFARAVDAKVRRFMLNRRRLIEVLNEQKQAIINRAVTRGLDPNVRLKPSGVDWLGDVPKHWTVCRLKRQLVSNDGGVWGSGFSDDGVYVLRSTEQTVDGRWRMANPAKRVLTQGEREAAGLRAGDLLVTKSSGSPAHIGKATLVSADIAAMGCCFSNFMQRLRLRRDVDPRFIWYVLNSPIARRQFCYLSNSTTGLGNLSGEILGAIWVCIPPAADQSSVLEQLSAQLHPFESGIGVAQHEIDLIREYRTRLIADVVTGKVDVRGLAPAESLPADEQIDEGIDDEEMPGGNESELAGDAGEND